MCPSAANTQRQLPARGVVFDVAFGVAAVLFSLRISEGTLTFVRGSPPWRRHICFSRDILFA
jgi:hypothetical protein